MRALSIPYPEYQVLTGGIEEITRPIEYPVIAKRSLDWGGSNIRLINNKAMLKEYISELGDVKSNPVVLEEYFDSSEITVGGVLKNGRYSPVVEYQTIAKDNSFELNYLFTNPDLKDHFAKAHAIMARLLEELNLPTPFLAGNFFVCDSPVMLEFGPVISHIYSNLLSLFKHQSPLKTVIDNLNGQQLSQIPVDGFFGTKIIYTRNDGQIFQEIKLHRSIKEISGFKGAVCFRDKGFPCDRSGSENIQVAAVFAVGCDIAHTKTVLDRASEAVTVCKK